MPTRMLWEMQGFGMAVLGLGLGLRVCLRFRAGRLLEDCIGFLLTHSYIASREANTKP